MSLAERIPYFSLLPESIQVLMLNLALLILALVVIWILRNLVARIVMLPLRSLVRKTETDIDDRAVDAIERPMRILVLGAGVAIVAAAFQFGPDLDQFSDSLSRALILAALMFFVYNLVDVIGLSPATMQHMTGITIEERLLPFLRTVAKVFVIVMAGLIIIQEFGYEVTGLIASFGVVGLALSLAAKDTAANVFGFTAIVSDNPFKVGDYIVTSDFSGTVEHVGARSTRVRKLDQSLVTVPNSKLTDAAVTNWSRLKKRRLDFYIGLTYDTSADQMRDVLHRLRELVKAHEALDPESVIVHFMEFAGSALNIRIIASVLLADWGAYTAEVEQINLEIMELIEELGLSFAFPSQSLYIETMPKADAGEATPTSRPAAVKRNVPTPPPAEPEIGHTEASFQDNPSASNEGDGGSE